MLCVVLMTNVDNVVNTLKKVKATITGKKGLAGVEEMSDGRMK